MVSGPRSLAHVALAGLLLPAAVSAHGSISVPAVTFNDIYNKNAPSATMSGTPGQYTASAVIRDLADQAGSTCGNTDGSAAAQPVPSDGKVTFDISAVHVGPCEVWLDDTKAASANDCWATYPDKAIPIDYSLCASGQCQLRWVWLATHNDPWEIYDNCVNVEGAGSGNSSSSASTMTTTAPAVTTPAPTAITTAPATTTISPATTTASPAIAGSEDDTPGTVTPAETSTTGSAACAYRGANKQTRFDAWCEANCKMNYCPESYCEADCS